MRDDAGCDRAALHGQDIAPPVRDARAVAPLLLSKSSAKRPRTLTRDVVRPAKHRVSAQTPNANNLTSIEAIVS
jgi:hypothetical protein